MIDMAGDFVRSLWGLLKMHHKIEYRTGSALIGTAI